MATQTITMTDVNGNQSIIPCGTITVDFTNNTTTVQDWSFTAAPASHHLNITGNALAGSWNSLYLSGEASADGYTRRPPPRNFNRYINASDLMEEFIAFLGTQGVRQSELLQLPIDLFIRWLIIRACEEDQEEPNVTLELPAPRRRTQPRCARCQRFMRRETAVPLHPGRCANRFFETPELVAS